MNQKLSSKAIQVGLWIGAVLLVTAASNQPTITFQVDMTDAIANSQFNPATQTVVASGSFDGWAALGSTLMTNSGAANPNLYSGTFTDGSDTPGKGIDYQYRIVQNGGVVSYSSQADSQNYSVPFPASGSLVLPVQFWDDAGTAETNSITFQVDMAEQLHLGTFNMSNGVYCQGSFEGWNDSFPLTNNQALNTTNAQGFITSLPYQGTYTAWSASPGAAAEYKFVYNNGADNYESPLTGDPDNNQNRGVLNTAQVLPLVNYSDVPFSSTVTNNVTFIVDMSVQEALGNFNPATGSYIEIHGDYNQWGSGTTLTNSPSDTNTSHYYFNWQYIGAQGMQVYFKYVIQPGTQWEDVSDSNSIGGNRWLALSQGNTTAGPVYFSDEGTSSLPDYVPVTNCMVTFTVDMSPTTNASYTGNSGGPFVIGVDSVYLNGLNGGVNNSFWGGSPWGGPLAAPPAYAMTEIGSSALYTITLPVNQGQPLDVIYKYGINGYDNEAGFADNHTRFIRSIPNYSMPTDVFGSQGSTSSSELSFGNFTVAKTNSSIALSWLGRTGIRLQQTTSLTPPIVWTQLPLTDGTNLIVTQGPGSSSSVGYAHTNYTIGSGNLFFELIGPQ